MEIVVDHHDGRLGIPKFLTDVVECCQGFGEVHNVRFNAGVPELLNGLPARVTAFE